MWAGRASRQTAAWQPLTPDRKPPRGWRDPWHLLSRQLADPRERLLVSWGQANAIGHTQITAAFTTAENSVPGAILMFSARAAL